MTLFGFIAAEKAEHPVSLMCRVLGVSRQGYWSFDHRPASQRALDDARLLREIRRIHRESGGTYGSPRVHAQLRREGWRVSRKRVERLMAKHGLHGVPEPRRKRGTTVRLAGVRPAPDLVGRDFTAKAPNRLWLADIKRIDTDEGPLHLAAVVDCFARRCVGWSMSARIDEQLVRQVLRHALARRRPRRGLIHHSDQGAQYTAVAFGANLRAVGIHMSMGSRGCALDNAPIEAFFASLEREVCDRHHFTSRAEARQATFEWIEAFYNRRRLHSTLGYCSPAEYEQQHERRTLKPIAGALERLVDTLEREQKVRKVGLISLISQPVSQATAVSTKPGEAQ